MSLLTIVVAAAVLAVPLPEGYRYPAEADRVGDWDAFKADLPTPYRAEADFNGDGFADEVWMLLREADEGWGLFVFLASPEDKPLILKLDESDGRSAAQGMGLDVVAPGKYRTACGKGYWDCEPGEPEELTLSIPAIDFFHFESANSFFWWDSEANEFARTWMSD